MLDVDSYLKRIGYSGPRNATLETLRALQALHPLAIPFENLDTLVGQARQARSALARAQARAKPPRRLLLRAEPVVQARARARSGSTPTALAARVVWERPAGEVRARTHMVLLVALGERRYVCDVGFGGLTPTAPIELTPGVEQPTPHETFRVVRVAKRIRRRGARARRMEAPLSIRPAGAAASRHRALESLRHEPCRVADAAAGCSRRASRPIAASGSATAS